MDNGDLSATWDLEPMKHVLPAITLDSRITLSMIMCKVQLQGELILNIHANVQSTLIAGESLGLSLKFTIKYQQKVYEE